MILREYSNHVAGVHVQLRSVINGWAVMTYESGEWDGLRRHKTLDRANDDYQARVDFYTDALDFIGARP